jgi:peptide chain release factor
MFPVSFAKAQALAVRLRQLGIREEDLEESFVHSGGSGGQNVNKVATCVLLVHRPSGTQVKCQQARTQGMNRYLARRILCERIERERLGAASAEAQRVAKLRRQKRRRSARAKEKVLRAKHARAETKSGRTRVGADAE